jgi:hypothetical protein
MEILQRWSRWDLKEGKENVSKQEQDKWQMPRHLPGKKNDKYQSSSWDN